MKKFVEFLEIDDGYHIIRWLPYNSLIFELNDKNVQLQNYPFELIKRMDTCHSRNISYTSYKLSTLYRILNLYIYIYIYIYIRIPCILTITRR
ncbi:hypothetical protein Hanom_Chr10g00887511 [Helianthus anomalus]